jgi:hypothetical protein
MTVARDPLLTAIPISDIGIRSTMLQATTEATLCLTANRGKMAILMCASTSDTSVEISTAVCETLENREASPGGLDRGTQAHRHAQTSRNPDPTLRLSQLGLSIRAFE